MFRWWALAIFVGAVGLSGFYRRRARRHEPIARSRESPTLVAGRLLVAGPFFAGLVAYVVNPAWMAWSALPLPAWARWTGVALGLAVVPAVQWVLDNLGRNVSETVLTKEHHELVTAGPYQWIRHPLYTTGSALLIALSLIAANWFLLMLAIVGTIAIRAVVVPMEERELTRRFGASYHTYRQRTGAMLPRVR